MTTQIGDREQRILKTLVESYVREGKPVGSVKIAEGSGLELSPATVRNVLGELEELGLVSSPHTSAGRVPTAKGYRMFVDTLLTFNGVEDTAIESFKQSLDADHSLQDLLRSASTLVSGFTHLAGLVTVPRRNRVVLRHIDFLQLSDNRVLAILVVNEREVQNRIIHTQRSYSAAQLQSAANYLNHLFCGDELATVRHRLLNAMKDDRERMGKAVEAVVEMAEQVFDTNTEADDFVLSGETNLMGFEELADISRLRELFEAFSRKREILHLLDQCINSQGVQIYIGEESGYDALGACSIVTSRYEANGEVLGVLGVIGPTRMDYERVIQIVDVTAQLLGAALKQRP